ncbi:hypothetical protein K6U06_13375 [Acidiferrimicrobium sp. IK]|uniref:sucrase ferredoxin n=1 Tax=Acidiferrimicrobium sp. IK TaxID=2871700 RepID=UPI0021CB85B9|nr:sucrase ferredoxin [Acidiferrimicrobium sp. IK]MCU4185359.1 hypothetical protein [Acidiferrimicrobium sp. IK]
MSLPAAGATPGTDEQIDLRCAAQMRAAGADPGGTAGTYDGYLLVEWPRPWPPDMGDIAALAPVRALLGDHARRLGENIRLQGLVPERPDRRRVVLYRRDEGPFSGYARRELDASVAPQLDPDGARAGDPETVGFRLADAAATLLAGPGHDAAPAAPVWRDVLVCTHGRRDRCCGSWGTELWQALSGADLPGDISLWRTSHTGGHRYAPTMLVLPEGTAWGFVDAGSARAILRREEPIEALLPLYRGCAGLPSPAVQAVERAVLAELGWSLLDTPRTGEDLGDGRVALVVDPDGDAMRWEATVNAGRVLPVPDCGALPSPGAKTATEQLVTGLVRRA